jgi:N-acetylmuramoyl-L-alanine amidase
MAIPNVSTFNNLIAQSVANSTGTDAALGLLSGGVISDSQIKQVNDYLAKDLAGIDTSVRANVPTDVYDNVAKILIGTTPGMSVKTLSAVLQANNVFGKVEGGLPKIKIGQLPNIQNEYQRKIAQIESKVKSEVFALGLPGFVQNAANAQINDTRNILNDALSTSGITDINGRPATVSDAAAATVNKLLAGVEPVSVKDIAGQYTTAPIEKIINAAADEAGIVATADTATQTLEKLAAATVQGENGGPDGLENYNSIIDQTKGTIKGLTEEQELDLIGPPAYEIGSDNVGAGRKYISSVEELEAEMASMTRDISEVIVHWSETFTNANLTAAQLTELTGSGDNAYHLIIRRDGAIERGVPLNSVGSHCPINNHNAYSIGVCLVGGINVPTDSRSIEMELSPRSITRSQYNSLYQIFRTFFNQYPGGQALGHMDVDVSQDDPGFDVRDYVYNNFNKQSLYTDPPNDPALSPQDILKALEAQGPDVLTKDPDVLEKKF